jgi:hypothetical protein
MSRNLQDILVEALQRAASKPEISREVLYFLVMDSALKCDKLSERKAWELIAHLIASISKHHRFPDGAELSRLQAGINARHRSRKEGTSDLLTSLKMFELGEASVREFLDADAWKGMPGFDPDEKGSFRRPKKATMK